MSSRVVKLDHKDLTGTEGGSFVFCSPLSIGLSSKLNSSHILSVTVVVRILKHFGTSTERLNLSFNGQLRLEGLGALVQGMMKRRQSWELKALDLESCGLGGASECSFSSFS